MTAYPYEGKEGKTAVSEYRVVENLAWFSLVEVTLHTGRTHQIRVHMQHIGHPIVGDTTYGGSEVRKLPFSKSESFVRNLLEEIPRQALHACELAFEQPTTKERLDFRVPLPDDMSAAIAKIGRVQSGAPIEE